MSNSSTFKNFAFISYSHADKKAARELQRVLDDFQLPNALKEKYPDCPVRLREIFRDDTGLPAGSNLTYEIQKQLKQSNYLIVICSPNAVKSHWVNKEIEFFKKERESTHIIPFIIDGIANAKQEGERECFPNALRMIEARGANISTFSFERAVIEVIAGALEIDVDDLWQRHTRAEEEKKRALQEQNSRLKIAQAKAVSQLALTISDDFRRNLAERLCLEVLPKSSTSKDRPYVANAEYALRMINYQESCYQDFFYLQSMNVSYAKVNISADCPFLTLIDSDAEFDLHVKVFDLINGKLIYNSLLPDSNYPFFKCDIMTNGLYVNDDHILVLHPNNDLYKLPINDSSFSERINMDGETISFSLVEFSQSGKLMVGLNERKIIGLDSNTGEKQFDHVVTKNDDIINMFIDEEMNMVICLSYNKYYVYNYLTKETFSFSIIGRHFYYDIKHRYIICNSDDCKKNEGIAIYNLFTGDKLKEIEIKGSLIGISNDCTCVYLDVSKGKNYRIKVFCIPENQVINVLQPFHSTYYALGDTERVVLVGLKFVSVFRYKQQIRRMLPTNKRNFFIFSTNKAGTYAAFQFSKNKRYNYFPLSEKISPYLCGGGSNDDCLCMSDSGIWMTQSNMVRNDFNEIIYVHKNLTIINTATNNIHTLEKLGEHDVYLSIRFAGDNIIMALDSKGFLSIWNIEKMCKILSISFPIVRCGDTAFLAVSHDNRKVAVCLSVESDDKKKQGVNVYIVSLHSRRNTKICTNMNNIEYAEFSKNNKEIALINKEMVTVLNVSTEIVVSEYRCTEAEKTASFSMDGKYILLRFSYGYRLEVLHIATGEIVFITEMPKMVVYASFCQDGKHISAVFVNGEVQIIEFLPFNKLLKSMRLQYKNVEFSKYEKNKYFLTD
jgi:hypothetical protein